MVQFQSREIFYKSPFGAAACGTEVRFRITAPPDLYVEHAELILNDGTADFVVPMAYESTTAAFNSFRVVYTLEKAGTFFYYFRLVTERGPQYIRAFEHGDGYLTGDQTAGGSYQLTVYSGDWNMPEGFSGGIFYQIFPDRFCASGKPHANVPGDRILRTDWGATPHFLPDEHGQITNNDYFCGDLEGIRSKLDYLKAFGVTALYLNPIFEAHSNHRYNTADYRKIDPLLGTEEDFIRLCADAKERGIRIILDGVFSHTGNDSIYFNRDCRYPVTGAANSTQSEYYPWYEWQHWPDRYTSWWGIDTLPAVNELYPSYTEFICGEGGVIDTWMKRGASGFRLDVADELPDEFIAQVRKAVKRHGDDKLLIGEVWEDASNKISYGVRRRYFTGDELDSVMNYPFKDAILQFVRRGDSEVFRDRILTICEHYPAPALHTAMNSLSTHDTARAITMLAGADGAGKDRLWQAMQSLSPERYHLGIKRLKLAMVLQYSLPGIPCIYYGDEAGLQGYGDPFNRGCYPWGQQNPELTAFAKLLGKIRLSSPALAQGDIQFLETPQDVAAFVRTDGEHQHLVYVNTIDADISLPLEEAFRSLKPFYGNVVDSTLHLKPYDFAIFVK